MTAVEKRVTETVPSRAGAAALVLDTVDNPTSSAGDVARAIGTDPGLTSRTLALANSGYYGLSRRVATTEFAVSVVGFDVVRSLALAQAGGLDRPGAVPEGFWKQAALSATAASAIAPMFGAAKPEAFCVGLLHTLGSALLNRTAPVPALCLPEPEDLVGFLDAEVELYGTDHATFGAQTLAAWNFPEAVCTIIAHHHDDVLPDADALTRVVQVSRLLAGMIVTGDVEDLWSLRELERTSQGRLGGFGSSDDLTLLIEQIEERAEGLYRGLSG